jgi:hypothetical protein
VIIFPPGQRVATNFEWGEQRKNIAQFPVVYIAHPELGGVGGCYSE